jgi:predicted MFS family arabinose efflux permease
MNFNVVLPVVAKETFGGTAATYGAMSAVMGVGALGGALLAARRVVLDLRLLAVAGFAFGVSLTAAAVAPNLRLELIALTCTGLASITFNASAGALIQLTARPEMRGRAIALKTLFNLGSTPIGGPILGYVSEHAGPRWSLAVGAGGCYIAVAAALRKRRTAPAPAVAAPEGDLLPGLEDVASVDA